MFGDYGYTMNWFGLKEFANKWNFEKRYIHSGKNKVKMNAYEDLKSEDVQWYILINCICKGFRIFLMQGKRISEIN